MIVYAYALRRVEPNPCNIKIAQAAKQIIDASSEPVVVCAQRSVAIALRQLGVKDIHETVKIPGQYEGSETVTDQAAEIFKAKGITEVIPVAQTFFQINKCIGLVKKAGFNTWPTLKLMREIGWIGFDARSIQPGTRGPIRQLAYMFRQVVFGYRYPPELSE